MQPLYNQQMRQGMMESWILNSNIPKYLHKAFSYHTFSRTRGGNNAPDFWRALTTESA